MFFIGDVHGAFDTYLWVVNKMQLPKDRYEVAYGNKDEMPAYLQKLSDELADMVSNGMDCSIQLGDMGIFRKQCYEYIPAMKVHKFIRGNHDNPELCKKHPNYLGDVGYVDKLEMFYVSGGFSIDRDRRTEGVDWWQDEEISYSELKQSIEKYGDVKPRIVISHEAPSVIVNLIHSHHNKFNPSRTQSALQAMFDIYKPDLWIFGHHHKKVEKKVNRTLFVGLNELKYGPLKECFYEVPGLTW